MRTLLTRREVAQRNAERAAEAEAARQVNADLAALALGMLEHLDADAWHDVMAEQLAKVVGPHHSLLELVDRACNLLERQPPSPARDRAVLRLATCVSAIGGLP